VADTAHLVRKAAVEVSQAAVGAVETAAVEAAVAVAAAVVEMAATTVVDTIDNPRILDFSSLKKARW
jgi:hypothetical protein